MSNKKIFASATATPPVADTKNLAGGNAFAMDPYEALAQIAMTGTFHDTFYTSALSQADNLLAYAVQVDTRYLGNLAMYSREKGYLKDMPAALCAILATLDLKELERVFFRALDNGKQIRNFVQMVRSGKFGRKSLGSGPKRLIKAWLNSKSDDYLFRASVGNDPSLADIVKMVHPKPSTVTRKALYAYLIGKEHSVKDLPETVRNYETFKKTLSGELPNVDFRLLTALPLTEAHWKEIARTAPWHMSRMNLNTFQRHNVFSDKTIVELVANTLKDRESIIKAKAFPYQLLAAYKNIEAGVPSKIRDALHDAMEIATENVPEFTGSVAVVVDVSGSMQNSVTGNRGTATSSVTCVDVAALIASCVLRKNRDAVVIPVDTMVHRVKIEPRDSVMTNAQKLAIGGGGTDLSAALQHIRAQGMAPDLILIVSDNESWADRGYGRSTGIATEFQSIRKKNPKAKLVCLDLTPNTTVQAKNSPNVLNLGGFSDQLFTTISRFANGVDVQTWVNEIRNYSIPSVLDNKDEEE